MSHIQLVLYVVSRDLPESGAKNLTSVFSDQALSEILENYETARQHDSSRDRA